MKNNCFSHGSSGSSGGFFQELEFSGSLRGGLGWSFHLARRHPSCRAAPRALGNPNLGGFHPADGQRGVSKRPSWWPALGSGIKVKPGSPEGVGLEILVGNLVVSTHPPELERMEYQRWRALDICISSLIFLGSFRYICWISGRYPMFEVWKEHLKLHILFGRLTWFLCFYDPQKRIIHCLHFPTKLLASQTLFVMLFF